MSDYFSIPAGEHPDSYEASNSSSQPRRHSLGTSSDAPNFVIEDGTSSATAHLDGRPYPFVHHQPEALSIMTLPRAVLPPRPGLRRLTSWQSLRSGANSTTASSSPARPVPYNPAALTPLLGPFELLGDTTWRHASEVKHAIQAANPRSGGNTDDPVEDSDEQDWGEIVARGLAAFPQEAEIVHHNPNMDRIVDALQAQIMASHDPSAPLPKHLASHVPDLLEGYRQQLQKIKTAEEDHARSLDQFSEWSAEWTTTEEQLRAEIKRLELHIAHAEGTDQVIIQRAKSVADRKKSTRQAWRDNMGKFLEGTRESMILA